MKWCWWALIGVDAVFVGATVAASNCGAAPALQQENPPQAGPSAAAVFMGAALSSAVVISMNLYYKTVECVFQYNI